MSDSDPLTDATWALREPSIWESPDDRSIPTLLAAIGQTLAAGERAHVSATPDGGDAEGLNNLCNAFERNRYDEHDWCLTHNVAVRPDEVCPVTAAIVASREAAAATRARAEALREAADEVDGVGHHWSGAPALAFFALAGDLRDRANEDTP